ncbi:glutamine-hydrolyzing GMP synthase [Fructilactobacillus lindneri]|uniref:GMP synthase [glutamine-hydrolyzing] n=1 Tax=Fructilactobacillus lindneri TaxID=53444 RepID=A0AB33BKM2_9LACO|nr:glutamine-hydrolyzing GMP synthase [Fructilactobacillus lindneri]ANZ57731.1 GMP synthetase [Fructilactobacillus lindneri]ANZ59001.1 GMP synthetase [Fructilactobacillus lindneri]POG99076.1 glutamine-hydrolyzing GMP synthase [Fructilactobacillus lindneri]POH03676.1 glutamine-hydrolyzing GMP synthase [Fructilactobacillus lindneri]
MAKTIRDYDSVVVLDFGSQYNQLITRRIREMGVYSELKPHTITAAQIKDMNPKAIIFSGGPNSVNGENALDVDPEIFKLGIPILGICYGMQLMAHDLPGGETTTADNSEYGQAKIEITDKKSKIFQDLKPDQTVLMSHGDFVTKVPDGFEITATSGSCPISAMADPERGFYAVQFHPEVNLTDEGREMLRHFVFDIAGAEANWSMEDFINDAIETIREKVGDKRVLLGLSGGVDSSVVAVLLHRAIGDQLVSVFVDHGLLRKDEAQQVLHSLGDDFGLNIDFVDAGKLFLGKLKDVTNPEKKRKIIGKEFIDTFSEEARKFDDVDFLAQGTLYTDVIESGTDTAQTIKSHHNVGGLPDDLQFKLIEPLNKLFKDEVRELGEKLGMPKELVWRQPFPGPGLAIRIIGEVTPERLRMVRDSDAILRDEFAKAGLDKTIWQYFTALPGIRSVGVMGDERTYDEAITIRAVTSVDGMTAEYAEVPWEVLGKVSKRIVDEVAGVNRVLYDITGKPPATIEYE